MLRLFFSSPPPLLLPSSSFVTIAVLVLTGILLVKIGRLFLAAAVSLFTWVLLGFLGVCIAEQPRHQEHVISLLEQGRVPLKTPLRWHGHLRDEPAHLPWGYGYEIELSSVEFEHALQATRGGLRLSFTAHTEGAPPSDLHAGDEVAVLTEAKRPQVFSDEGAFDRRAYLAQQNIDLVAILRAPELIVRIASPTPTIGTVLARARRRLREEIDELFSSTPQVAGVLRAMLLGDRSFVDQAEAADFQKTGVFHVLVVAGLHVGALAFALYWVEGRLRLSRV
jgi:competence protein ComEC